MGRKYNHYYQDHLKQHKVAAIKGSVGFGTVLAMIISYNLHESVWWAIIHGILNWIYVWYYLIFG